MRRWHLVAAAVVLIPGLMGFTGSSWAVVTRTDLLLDDAERSAHLEVFGTSRPIRSDEWAVNLPMARVQQVATPAFPLVSMDLGLGHLQRAPSPTPVLDWGLAFRPLLWPLLTGTRWSHGVRWFLRNALLLAGLLAWFHIAVLRAFGDPVDARRRSVLATAAAFAVFMSSAVQWWLDHAMIETLAFLAMAMAAAHQRDRATRHVWRIGWLVAFGYLATCAFFPFYPPIWGPMLWVACAELYDQQWMREGDLRRAITRSLPFVAVLALGVVLAIAYYLPYVELVSGTVYPGRRLAASGALPWSRILELAWPSLSSVAPLSAQEAYVGSLAPPFANACEGSSIEATPFLVLAVMCALDGGVRAALRATVRRHPASAIAWGMIAAWLWLPLPAWFGAAALLQWSPAHRAWFAFGLATALVTTRLLAEVAASPAPRPLARVGGVAVLALTLWLALTPQRLGLARELRWTYWPPIALCAVLTLVALWALGRRWGAHLLALAWALPLIAANAKVNPLLRTSDLFVMGSGHRVVAEALGERPGRLLDYTWYMGDVLAANGWPIMGSVQMTPNLGLFRFLSPRIFGLTEDLYNRYAHVHFAFPGRAPFVNETGDALIAPLSPCSDLWAALGVNHVLVPARLPPGLCGDAFRSVPVGRLQLWSRVRPAGVGYSPSAWASSALDFDYTVGAGGERAVVTRERDRLVIEVPPGASGAFSLPLNLSLVDEIRCTDVVARKLDVHLVVSAIGPAGGRCEVRFVGTLGALRRFLGRPEG